jgi:hypothetical protein
LKIAQAEPASGFVLMRLNGPRIKSSRNSRDAELACLIPIAEGE